MKRFLAVIFGFLIVFTHILTARELRFIAFGDWGRNGLDGQQQCADEMGKFASQNKTDFVLVLGDNFYPKGVISTDDLQWKTSFENVYTAASLQIPWYVTIGNHDYGGNVNAQIDYSKLSTRWILPARYYSKELKVGSSKLLLVILDSNPFITSYHMRNPEDDELGDSSVADINRQDINAQLDWLETVLSSSDAKWKIAAAHHPVYSGGVHGNTPELIEKFKPILEKYKVNLYLCGHDHDMQYLKPPDGSVNYFVAGSGSQLRKAGSNIYSKFYASENGFLAVTVSEKSITAKFVDVNGKELYSVVLN